MSNVNNGPQQNNSNQYQSNSNIPQQQQQQDPQSTPGRQNQTNMTSQNDANLDTQERDRRWMAGWGFASDNEDEEEPEIVDGQKQNENDYAQQQQQQPIVFNPPPRVNEINQQPYQPNPIGQVINNSIATNISSIRATPMDNAIDNGQHQQNQQNMMNHQMGGIPQNMPLVINQSNIKPTEQMNANIYGSQGQLPQIQEKIQNSNSNRDMNADMGDPLSISQLEEIHQINPIQSMIQEQSEDSNGSQSNLDNTRQRQKRRMKQKYRGANPKSNMQVPDQNNNQNSELRHQKKSKRQHKKMKDREQSSGDKSRLTNQEGDSSFSSSGSSSGSYSDNMSSEDSNHLIFHDQNNNDSSIQNNNMMFASQMDGGGQQMGAYPVGIQMKGGILNDYSSKASRESHLLPIQFAKDHILKIEEDMKKMHERHVKLMREMDQNYRLIEQETQDYYLEFLQKWKDVAKKKIIAYRRTTEELAEEKAKLEKDKNAEIDQLTELNTKLMKEKNIMLKEQCENIMIRDEEIESQKQKYDNIIRKKDQELFNLKNKNEQYEMRLTQLQVQYKDETDQLKYQQELANKQIQTLQNQADNDQDKIQQMEIELQISTKELDNEKQNNEKLQAQVKQLKEMNLQKVKEIEDKIKENYQQQSELKKNKDSVQDLQRQIDQLVQDQAHNTQSSLVSGMQSSAQGQIMNQNQDQGQISSSFNNAAPTQNFSNQSENNTTLSRMRTNIKVRPSTGERNILQNLNQNIKGGNLKIKGMSAHGGKNNVVFKPGTILQNANPNFNSAQKQGHQLQPMLRPAQQMSEQDYETKRSNIHKDYGVQQEELEKLIQHYQTQVEKIGEQQENDVIIAKFEKDKADLNKKRDEDLSKLLKQYESGQKQQQQMKNLLNNRNLSIQSANRSNYNTSNVDDKQSSTNNPNVGLSINLKNVNGPQNENPYSSNKITSMSQQNPIMQIRKQSGAKNESVLSNIGQSQNHDLGQNVYNKNFQSLSALNSAREPISSKKGPDIMDEKQVKELKDQVNKAKFENTQLKQRVSDLTNIEKELLDAKSSILQLQSQCETHRQDEQSLRKVEDLERQLTECQKLVDELKKQKQTDVALYNRNMQYMKNQYDKQKQQIEKLKLLVQKNNNEVAEYNGKIKSLETVNEKIQSSLEESKVGKQLVQKQNKDLKEKFERFYIKYQNESVQRKKLHNVIEDMKGKIRVYCRVRPMNQNEVRMGCIDAIQIVDQFTLRIRVKKEQQLFKQSQIASSNQSQQSQDVQKEYVFDACFDSKTSQEEIFEDTKMLIQSAIDGFNVCIFAYGQTGSGKTYTVTGDSDNMGIVPRAFMSMFQIRQRMEVDNQFDVGFECYMVELYLDKLHDLLTSGQRIQRQSQMNQDKLTIMEEKGNGMVYIQNVKMKELHSFQEALDTFNVGLKSRKSASTEMNDMSSRSHLIFSVVIQTKNNKTGQISRSKISFVDLAGSERLSKSNPNTNIERLKESNAINLSLKSLGDVIQGLSNADAQSRAHIPYRSNKLTHLMKDSLGGNSKTLMFVNISPADYNSQESQYSLQYGVRAKMIQNEVTKNIESEQVHKLKQENQLLKRKLQENQIQMT